MLIITGNINYNECFKSCLLRYSHPTAHHLQRNIKVDRLFGDELDLESITLTVEIKDILSSYMFWI